MLTDSLLQNPTDIVALAFFLICWGAYSLAMQGRVISRPSLSALMNRQREVWMRTMAQRELRMIDTSIMNGLQQGTAFFASSCLIAIGGCFALLGSTDAVLNVLADIPTPGDLAVTARPMFEAKVFGLIAALSYAFFKFGWSYRLFNYCSILIGAVPILDGGSGDQTRIDAAVAKAARMNVLAGQHFNIGMRAIFFSIGYLGWFAGPWTFMASTVFILAVLVRRQFFSRARRAVLEEN